MILNIKIKTGSVLFILFIILNINSIAQENKILKNYVATVYTPFMDAASGKTDVFLKTYAKSIVSRSESNERISLEFFIEEDKFTALDSLLKSIGYVSSKEINTENIQSRIDELKLDISHLQQSKTAYEKELAQMSDKDQRYYTYWEKVQSISDKILEREKELKNFEKDKYCKVRLYILNEQIDLSNRDINWVNMPGVSAEMLWIESPDATISAKQFMGYSIKYIFTRGKTYANIGALKKFSTEDVDSTAYKELFLLGFGQDFYSRYLGRGKRKSFNLYTGYNIGAVFATGEDSKKLFAYLTPFFGFEWFKNRYILLDNRVGYFVPLYNNRNLRGIVYNISFNFAF